MLKSAHAVFKCIINNRCLCFIMSGFYKLSDPREKEKKIENTPLHETIMGKINGRISATFVQPTILLVCQYVQADNVKCLNYWASFSFFFFPKYFSVSRSIFRNGRTYRHIRVILTSLNFLGVPNILCMVFFSHKCPFKLFFFFANSSPELFIVILCLRLWC